MSRSDRAEASSTSEIVTAPIGVTAVTASFLTLTFVLMRTMRSGSKRGCRTRKSRSVRFEAERMAIAAREAVETSVQAMNDFGASLWSQGKQLFVAAKHNGAVVLRFDVRQPARHRVRVLGTAAPDYGTIHVRLDGRSVGPPFDLFSGRVCPAGSLELGTHELAAGEHRLRVASVGKDSASGGFSFGLDTLDLLRLE